MKRESKALYSTLVGTSFGYVAQLLSLFAIPLYLQSIGTEGYGLIVTVMAFMGYLNFADAGLSWGAMILIAQAAGRKNTEGIAHIVRHGVVLALGSGFVVILLTGCLVLMAARGWRLPMFTGHPQSDVMVAVAAFQLVATLQFAIVYNLFQGLQDGYLSGFYQGLGRLCGMAGGVAAAWATGQAVWVVAAFAASTVIAGVAALVHAYRRYPWAFTAGSWFDMSQYAAQVRIGLKNFLIQIGRTLAATAPALSISALAGPSAVPFFTVPLTVLSLFFTPLNSWNANLQGAYGEAWISGDRDWVRSAFRESLLKIYLFGGLGLALFFALGDGFVRVWTHGRLSIGVDMAVSVSMVVLTGALLGAGQYLLTGLNRHGRASVAEIANGVLALVLVVGSVKWFGTWAAGFGVAAAAMLSSAWVVSREIRQHLGAGCFPSVHLLLKSLLAALLGWAVAAAVFRVCAGEIHQGMALAVSAATGVGLFFTVTQFTGLFQLEDASRLARAALVRVGVLQPHTRGGAG